MKNIFKYSLILLFLSFSTMMSGQAVAQGAFDFTGAQYNGVSLDMNDHIDNSRGLHFKPDGTRFYHSARTSMNIAEYHMSTPWDISTAEFVREFDLTETVGVNHERPRPHGLFINDENGQEMYLVNRTEMIQYFMEEPWDISTTTHTKTRDMRLAVSRLHDMYMSPDGGYMFIDDRETWSVYQFRMDMIWDIDDLRLEYMLDISEMDSPRGMEWKPDGSRLFLVDQGARTLKVYDVEEPWNLRTAERREDMDFMVARQTPNPRGLVWAKDGKRFYVVCNTTNTLFQYDVP